MWTTVSVDAVVGRRDTDRLGILDFGEPQARVLVPDPGPVEAPCVVADAPRGRIVLVADDEPLDARAGGEQEPGAVGRPLGGEHSARELGDLLRLAAGRWKQPRLWSAGAVGDEDDSPAVGREARPAVAALGAGQLLWGRALEVGAPQVADVLAVFDRALDVDDGGLVLRHGEGADHDLFQHVAGLKGFAVCRGRGRGLRLLSFERLHPTSMSRTGRAARSDLRAGGDRVGQSRLGAFGVGRGRTRGLEWVDVASVEKCVSVYVQTAEQLRGSAIPQ